MSATQLYYTLIWPKEPPPLVDHLLQVHLLTLEGWLDDAVWIVKYNDAATYKQFSEVLGTIGREERQRFLLAPSTFPLLAATSSLELDACRDVLRAYQHDILLTREDPRAPHGWSRLTDFVQTHEGHRQYSDLLGDSIVVDFDSEECLRVEPESSVFCREPVPVSAADREVTLTKLRAALNLIDRISSTAGHLIRNTTRCIRVRKSTTEITAAETDPRVIGEMRLHNPQMDSLRVIDLADALIHESLHNFLAMYELRYGSFVGFQQSALIRPPKFRSSPANSCPSSAAESNGVNDLA